MDLLFVRYASPFVLLDGLIMTNSLNSFVDDFFDFVKEIEQSENQKPIDLGATLVKSKNMLSNFTPT